MQYVYTSTPRQVDIVKRIYYDDGAKASTSCKYMSSYEWNGKKNNNNNIKRMMYGMDIIVWNYENQWPFHRCK